MVFVVNNLINSVFFYRVPNPDMFSVNDVKSYVGEEFRYNLLHVFILFIFIKMKTKLEIFVRFFNAEKRAYLLQ